MSQVESQAVLQLAPDDLHLVKKLLQQYLPGTEVWAYGSRVKGVARPSSDLDLVAFASLDQHDNVLALRDAFEDSDLPFRVDLFRWDDMPESFKRNILREHIVAQHG